MLVAQRHTANPPDQPDAGMVANDGWFPDVNLDTLKTEWRIDSTVSDARLRREVIDAIVEVNHQLADWQAQQRDAGYATLGDVPAGQVNGASAKLRHYLRAVAATVLAKVVTEYRDLDTLPDGAGKEARVKSALHVRQDEFWREVRWALADLQGKRRTIVALL